MSFSSTGLQATCSRDISPLPHCPPAPFHIQEELDKHVCFKPISLPASSPLSQSREEGHWCNSHFYSICNFIGTFRYSSCGHSLIKHQPAPAGGPYLQGLMLLGKTENPVAGYRASQVQGCGWDTRYSLPGRRRLDAWVEPWLSHSIQPCQESEHGFIGSFLGNILVPPAFQWGRIITLCHSGKKHKAQWLSMQTLKSQLHKFKYPALACDPMSLSLPQPLLCPL